MSGSQWVRGTKLNDRYTIRNFFRGSGDCIICLAEDEKLSRQVIIKSLDEQKIQKDPNLNFNTLQEDLKNEAKHLAKFSHPNIVTIYDIFQDNKTSLECIVTEYIQGETLDKKVKDLKSGQNITEADALNYINHVANALKLIHAKNLIHQDITPTNIIIEKNTNKAVLIDFGNAREIGIPTKTNYVSQPYAAPEQIENNQNNQFYTDVYMLAATFYYVLTNEPPPSAEKRRIDKINGDIDPLSYAIKKNKNISIKLSKAIMKGMELKTNDRFKSVDDFLKSLPQKPQKLIDIKLLGWTILTAAGIWLILHSVFQRTLLPWVGIHIFLGIILFIFAQTRSHLSFKHRYYQFALSVLTSLGIYLLFPGLMSVFPAWALTLVVAVFTALSIEIFIICGVFD
ncbi:serine/threonine-protein kinase [Scytonema sp. PCC 10023]|uniref:serine/threonine-protein kinase n=1 Tax=Scytonema sp. PCC 10023 TaxID=1680591 RepID=UPI0039C6244A